MPFPTRACLVLALLAPLGCAAKKVVDTSASIASCPNRVVATISNPRNLFYDVYYQDRNRSAVIIGESSPHSTTTFTIPGEGRGHLYLYRAADLTGTARTGNTGNLPDVRIRVRCAGT